VTLRVCCPTQGFKTAPEGGPTSCAGACAGLSRAQELNHALDQANSRCWEASTATHPELTSPFQAARRHQRPQEPATYETAHLINPYLRSYLHRNRLLSTDAHALLISGNTPQKHMVWQVRYLSCTMAGKSGEVGETARRREGHCTDATAQHHTSHQRRVKPTGQLNYVPGPLVDSLL